MIASPQKHDSLVLFTPHRMRAQATALLDAVNQFLTEDERAAVLAHWELVCEINGWSLHSPASKEAA